MQAVLLHFPRMSIYCQPRAATRAPEHVLRGQAQLAVALIVCAIDMWVDVSPGVTVMIPAIIQVISRVAWKET